MQKKPKFKPRISRVQLNPEQAVLACSCWNGTINVSSYSYPPQTIQVEEPHGGNLGAPCFAGGGRRKARFIPAYPGSLVYIASPGVASSS